jgi:hypothetical protein
MEQSHELESRIFVSVSVGSVQIAVQVHYSSCLLMHLQLSPNVISQNSHLLFFLFVEIEVKPLS